MPARSGLVLALLALLAQLATGAFVPRSVDLFAMQAMPICFGESAAHPAPATPAKHRPDFKPSPFCTVMLASAVELPAAPVLPAPMVLLGLRPELPASATAPPAAFRVAAQPRGPPAHLT